MKKSEKRREAGRKLCKPGKTGGADEGEGPWGGKGAGGSWPPISGKSLSGHSPCSVLLGDLYVVRPPQ